MNTPKLNEAYIANFETLKRASLAGDLALMSCVDKVTRKPVAVVCCVQREGTEYVMVPIAKMFDANPYDELEPPR